VVLAQSPAPGSGGLTGPRVALLVSDEQEAPATIAYVMPSIVGMTLYAASARLGAVGLHIASAQPEAAAEPSAAATAAAPPNPLDPSFNVVPPPVSVNAVIVAQSPLPGHRISRGDAVRVTLQ
jgi:beta-lactam-binding protein with PASTA domain